MTLVEESSFREWCSQRDVTGENTFVADDRKVQCKVRREHGDDYDPGENEHIDKFYVGDEWVYISVARPDHHRVKFDFDEVDSTTTTDETFYLETPSTTARI